MSVCVVLIRMVIPPASCGEDCAVIFEAYGEIVAGADLLEVLPGADASTGAVRIFACNGGEGGALLREAH